MRIQSKLCHISEDKAVVKVNAWINGKNLGSALAEGLTVEIAEEKAITRLNKRLSNINTSEEKVNNNIDSNKSTNRKEEKINGVVKLICLKKHLMFLRNLSMRIL